MLIKKSGAILNFQYFLLIEMEEATPRGSARVLDPGLSTAREAAKAVPPRKASAAMKSVAAVNDITLSHQSELPGFF